MIKNSKTLTSGKLSLPAFFLTLYKKGEVDSWVIAEQGNEKHIFVSIVKEKIKITTFGKCQSWQNDPKVVLL